MFNRVTKLTALVVAMGSTMALVSGQSAYAVNRLEAKDGQISDAVSYNGKYIYDGYKDDNSTDIYFSTGSNDSIINNNDDYNIDLSRKYGQKYILAEDGGDNYLLDVSTGRIDDGESIEDKKNTLEGKLKNTLKKTDRYENITNVSLTRLDILQNKRFGDVWYQYDAGDGQPYGFVNESGKYLDICNLANLFVVDNTGDVVKLEEYGKENKGLKATLNTVEVLAQDNSNFYLKVTVTVENVGAATNAPINSELTYLQKVSKSQGAQKDEAYLPSSVTSYLITDIFASSDADDGAIAMNEGGEFVVSGGNLYTVKTNSNTEIKVTKFILKKDKLNLQDEGITSSKLDIQVVEKDDDETHDTSDGANYSIDTNGNVWSLNKGKLFKISGLTSTDVYTCDSSLRKLSVYNDSNFVLWDDRSDVYAAVVNGTQSNSVVAGSDDEDDDQSSSGGSGGGSSTTTDTNTNGTVNNGTVNNGVVNNGTVTDTTTNTNGTVVNGTVNNGTVANGTVANGTVNNGVVNNGVVNNGAVTNTTTVQPGWVQNADTSWSYGNVDGSKKISWLNDNGTWYFFDGTGTMKKGWLADGANWYHMDETGAMETGWVQDNGNWYHLNESGVMETGWLKDEGNWYYLKKTGAMAMGWICDQGNWYYMQPSGIMAKGWVNDNGTWYYLNQYGIMMTNAVVDGYTLGASGAMEK